MQQIHRRPKTEIIKSVFPYQLIYKNTNLKSPFEDKDSSNTHTTVLPHKLKFFAPLS